MSDEKKWVPGRADMETFDADTGAQIHYVYPPDGDERFPVFGGLETAKALCDLINGSAGLATTAAVAERWPEWWISDYDGSVRTGEDHQNGDHLDEQEICDGHNALRDRATRMEEQVAGLTRERDLAAGLIGRLSEALNHFCACADHFAVSIPDRKALNPDCDVHGDDGAFPLKDNPWLVETEETE